MHQSMWWQKQPSFEEYLLILIFVKKKFEARKLNYNLLNNTIV